MKKRIQCFSLRLFCLNLFIVSFGFTSQDILAQTFVASDNASNYIDWTQGSNGGYGLNNWNLVANGGTGFAGWFLGNPNDAGISGLPNPSFGLYANPAGSGAFVNADRNLAYPLPVGASLSFMWGVNWDSDGEGNKGVNLYVGGVGGTQVININQGGSAVITINDNPMFNQYGTQAMTLNFERASATQLRVYGLGRDGAEVYDYTFALTSSAIDAIRFYAHNLAGGDNRQPYFNNIRISFPQNHTLNGNAIVSAVEITGGTIFGTGTNTLSVGPGGFFTNNGAFEPGTGTVIFTGSATLGGSAATSFYHLVLDAGDGNGVDFGSGLCEVLHEFELRSGFVDTHAPSLAEGSTLFYATNGSYVRELEWNNPWNVRVGFNTSLNLNLNEWGGDISIGGNLTIDENSALSIDAGPQPWDLIINGNLSLSGTLALSTSFGRDLQIRGDWHQTGTLAHNQREVIFNGTSMQQIHNQTELSYMRINNPGGEVILLDNIEITNRIEIDPQATFNMQDKIISGGGDFVFHSEGILKIGHPEGISTVANTGNVQVTGAKFFASAATYHYIGQENQVSGNVLLEIGDSKNIIIELSSDNLEFRVNTTSMIVVNEPGFLHIVSGTLLETQSGASKAISGNGNLIMDGGRYLITSIGATVDKPRLNGFYSITGGIIELGAAGNQKLNAGKSYHNLVFSGSGVVTASTTTNISGTVTIRDEKILDLGNSAFGDATTRLTMTGGRIITSATGTSPTMGGDYNLSGGVIQFANNDVTLQTIRGPESRQYFNIEVTGSRVANSNGNISIKSGGTFRILPGARFQITHVAVVGLGHFELEPGGTLAFGHGSGITLADCGTEYACGNIRTLTRNFSQIANYELFGNASPQRIGSGIPATVQKLVINKNAPELVVELTQNLQVAEFLVLNQGVLDASKHDISLNNPNFEALVVGFGNEDFSRSFIIGSLTRSLLQTNEDYFYPIGRDDGPQTAILNINEGGFVFSGNPRLKITFSSELPDNYYGDLPQIFDNILVNTLSENGYWNFQPENITTAIYTLSLSARDFNGINFPDGIRIIKRQNSTDNWSMAGENFSFDGLPGNYVFSQENIDGFSEFALGGNILNNPLPVEWLSFTARNLGQEVLLQWQTATETNNSHFSILRSANGTDYALLDVLQGAGNSNKPLTYSFIDPQPEQGLNYYKIRQTDFDGQTQYSSIQVVDFSPRFAANISYHNGRLHFHLPESNVSAWNYQLVDLQGNILLQGAFETSTGNRDFSVDVSWLNSRLFMVVLRSHDHLQTEKFLIGH